MRSAAVVLDPSDEVVLANPAARQMGVVRGGRVVVDELRRLARSARRDGEPRHAVVDTPRGRLGREPIAVSVQVAPLMESGYVALMLDDVTEQRRLDAVRRDFVANVSHELKTPVGALTLLAEAVQDAADDPEAIRRFAGRMQHEGNRLGRLVAELIELSRLQGAEPLPPPAIVEVDDVVAEAVDRTRLAAESAGITVVAGGERRLTVRGSESQLVTALVNLVDNAVAYSPVGTRVAVGTRRRDGQVEISVSDQGIGIAEGGPRARLRALLPVRPGALAGDRRHRARAGDRQARRHQPRRRGLGLERGGLRARPSPCGCRRRRADPATRPPRPARPGGGAAGAPADQGPPRRQERDRVTRVLVVEDEESFSEALSYMLRREGFEVAVAATGPDALSQFDRAGADLVLLDLMLPGLSGTEVCRTLRQRSNVPVIMLTARDSEIDKVVGLELGADDYVTKPFSSRELVARIRAVLRRRGEPEDQAPAALEAGPVRMDVDRHVVTVNGGTVPMPLKEFDLLELLLRNAGRVLTRGQLIDRVWGADYVGDTKTLDVHVKRLRAKIEPDPANPRHLVTVRGLGYKFET